MEDITFDTYGVSIKQQEMTLMDKYRDKLREKFKSLVQSLDVYQREIVFDRNIELPLKITANAGCLHGDTIIKVNRAGKSFKVKLKDAYVKFNGGGKYPAVWDLIIDTKIRSYYSEDSRIKLNKVLNIVKSGVKELFRVVLENGVFLDCTSNHEVLTKCGWVEAINLTNKDCVCMDTLTKHKKTSNGERKDKLRDVEIRVGEFHPYCTIKSKSKNAIFYRVPKHRAIYESHVNGMSLNNYIKTTYNKEISSKLYFVDTTKYCIHHKNFDHFDDTLDNLEGMNKSDHNKLHTKGYNNFRHGVPVFVKVKEVINLNRKEMTYDIQCETPHNFVANGIVVHNSGKTQCLLAKALKMVIEDKIYPGSIVLITFTNKAANEIKERYINFFRGVLSEGEITEISLPHMSTIHSFACFILYKLFGLRRTILTEYHALKLLKSIVLKVLKLPKIEQVKVKAIYALIQKIYANNEVHFFCIPQFNPDSTFHKILLGRDSNLFDCFSRTGITARLKGRVELGVAERDEVKRGYASEIGITIDQLTEILILFLERKYISNTMDFSDMRFLPFCILNQYKSKLQEVWEDYKYFIIDEAQDINCMDFSLAVTCDKDSYKRFLG